eukprot:Opistho-1_new@61740
MALKNVVLPAPLGPMMPMSSPVCSVALTPSTAVRPPKRTVTLSMVRRALAMVRSHSGFAPLPQRGQAVGQVHHAQDQQQAQHHHVAVGQLQAQRLGQQAEHDGRQDGATNAGGAADQCDQHRLEADEGAEHGCGLDVRPAHRHGRAHGACKGGGDAKARDLGQARVHAQRLRALLVSTNARERQAKTAALDGNGCSNGGCGDQQHREVHRLVAGHHREHAAYGAGHLLFDKGDRMSDQLRHAKGQHREIGAAQVQHGRAHHHRHRGGNQCAAQDHQRPGQHGQQRGAGVGTNAEEGRRGQRQVARGAAKQRPAGGQRDVHQAAEQHRRGELGHHPRQGGDHRHPRSQRQPGLVGM